MRFLVTGSAGHLGEALLRTLMNGGHEVVGLDIVESDFTTAVSSIAERRVVEECMDGVDVVFHAATLHKPHVATHSRQEFVDTNITGTLNLLEAAAGASVKAFIYTSTTSVFGDALIPPPAWITEEVAPVPRNIYGMTKSAAEDLCQLFHRNQGLACVVLRTSRFFPEEDDNKFVRETFTDENVKANEYLYRRVDIEDVVTAHLLAADRARELSSELGFRKYIISATTPFRQEDLPRLRNDAPAVVRERVAEYETTYRERGWKMFPGIDRVYVNDRAREELGWQPRYDFGWVIKCLKTGEDFRSPLARVIGSKGYHDEVFAEGPYPVE